MSLSSRQPLWICSGRMLISMQACGSLLFSTAIAILSEHVRVVLGFCPKKQVFRSATTRNIAAVKNAQAFGNRPKAQEPCRPMCEADFSAYVVNAVALFVCVARPQPTGAEFRLMRGCGPVFVDPLPKRLLDFLGRVWHKLTSCIRSHTTSGVRAPALTQSIPVLVI